MLLSSSIHITSLISIVTRSCYYHHLSTSPPQYPLSQGHAIIIIYPHHLLNILVTRSCYSHHLSTSPPQYPLSQGHAILIIYPHHLLNIHCHKVMLLSSSIHITSSISIVTRSCYSHHLSTSPPQYPLSQGHAIIIVYPHHLLNIHCHKVMLLSSSIHITSSISIVTMSCYSHHLSTSPPQYPLSQGHAILIIYPHRLLNIHCHKVMLFSSSIHITSSISLSQGHAILIIYPHHLLNIHCHKVMLFSSSIHITSSISIVTRSCYSHHLSTSPHQYPLSQGHAIIIIYPHHLLNIHCYKVMLFSSSIHIASSISIVTRSCYSHHLSTSPPQYPLSQGHAIIIIYPHRPLNIHCHKVMLFSSSIHITSLISIVTRSCYSHHLSTSPPQYPLSQGHAILIIYPHRIIVVSLVLSIHFISLPVCCLCLFHVPVVTLHRCNETMVYKTQTKRTGQHVYLPCNIYRYVVCDRR